MDLNWTTFLLEAVNFLVLVWILKRFLYKPVLDVIARRRARIEQALAESRARNAEAEDLEARYRDRLEAWERERQEARDALNKEIAAERGRLMEGLKASVAEERRKADVVEARRRAEEATRGEEQAVRAGLAFTARLLERLADSDLEARLVRLAVADLNALPEPRRKALKEAVSEAEGPPVVTTAHPLAPDLKDAVAQALADVLGVRTACEYREDAALIAGPRVSVGPWVLKGSLKDELEFFGGAAGPVD